MTNWITSPSLEQFLRNPNYAASRWLTWTINVIDTAPIFIHRPESANGRKGKVTLSEMGEALGVVDPSIIEKLYFHQKRLAKYDRTQNIFVFASIFLISILGVFATVPVADLGSGKIFSLLDYLDSDYSLAPILNTFLGILLFGLLFFLIYLIIIIPMMISAKVVAILTDKRYAESINIWILVCLIFELVDDNVLRNLGSQKALIQRIHDLALGTSLLSLQYPIKDPDVKTWSRKHFHQMKQYVLERGCWVVAPVDTTLEDLRRDFRWLFDIYINNRYGHISWQEDKAQESDDQDVGQPEKVVTFLPRLLGYLIPIGILVYLILNPNVVGFLNLKADTIGLITLGWVLLGIDTLLGLGVTTTITDFLKGLKELSS